MDRLIGIPNIEIRIQRPKHLGIVTDGSYDDGRFARFALRRPLHPMPNVAADGAFVIEQENWLSLPLHQRQLASAPDSKGCVTAVRTPDTVGDGDEEEREQQSEPSDLARPEV